MSKRQTLMILGAVVFCFLFLGFPLFWEKLIAMILGITIIVISYKLLPVSKSEKKLSFIEHKNEAVPAISTDNIQTNTSGDQNRI